MTDINNQDFIDNKLSKDDLLNSIDDAIIATDLSGKIIYWNKAAEKIYKWKAEEVIGKNIINVTPLKNNRQQANEILESLKKGETWKGEFEVKDKDGNEFPIHVTDSPLVDEKGNLTGIIGSSRIIDKQFESWKLAKEKEESYRILAENTFDWEYWIDPQGNYIYMSPACERITGYHQNKFLKKPEFLFEITAPEYKKQVENHYSVISEIEHHTEEFLIISKNRNKVWIEHSCVPVYDDKGNFRGRRGINRDITERKKAEITLKINEEKYRNLFENLTEEVHLWKILYDKKGQIKTWELVDANPSALKSWKKTRKEVVGKKAEEIFNSDTVKQFSPIVNKIFETGQPLKWEEYFPPTNQLLSMESIPFGDYFISTGRDITEQHEIEQKLKQSDRVFNLSLDMFCIAGFDGYFKYLNPAWEKTLGWSVEELLSKPWLDFVHPDDKINTENVKSVIVDGKEVYQFENRYVCKDGSIKWLSWNSQSFPDENIMIGAVRDVTETKRTEKELLEAKRKVEENKEKLNLLIKNSNDIIVLLNKEGEQFFISSAVKKITGFTADELIGPLANIMHPDDMEITMKAFSNLLKNKNRTERLQFRHKHKEKGYIWLEAVGQNYLDNPFINAIIVNTRDISKQKETEIELTKAKEKAEESEKQLRLIADNFVNGMIYQVAMIDENRRQFNYISKNVEELYGCTAEAAKKDASLIYGRIHPDDIKGLIEKEKVALKTMSTFETEARTIAPNGKIRWAYYVSKPRLIDGIVCWDGIEIDITERKQMELELIKAKEKAEEADRLKSAFLANMSHEIRTPMNGILGFTSLLQQDDLTGEQQHQYIEIIKKSGDRMLNTVNDIIEISKIETGQIKLSNTKINLSEHLKTLYNFFSLEAQKKGLKLSINNKISKDESSIITDKSKVSSILTNLIKNALKFTKIGNIEIGCKRDVDLLSFYVKDTGIGIPSSRIDAIFNRFEQADIEDKAVHEGSGLGLAITKSYVELLGGSIWVESKENNGSTFYFTIPYIPAKSKTKNKNIVQSNETNNLNVLIVEDDATSALYLSTILKKRAKNIQIAKDGLEAVEMSKNNSNIDLILMDIKLPKLDGLKATKRIREFNNEVKIIAQTAQALEGDREQTKKAGCDEYISKPINKEKLNKLIDKLFK